MTAIAQAFREALLGFVWQGLVVAFVLWIVLFALRRRSARARYAVCCAALALMAVLPVMTGALDYSYPAAALPAARAGGTSVAVVTAAGNPVPHDLDWAAWLLPAWSIGVLLFSLRLVWAARRISAVKKQAQAPDDGIAALAGLTPDQLEAVLAHELAHILRYDYVVNMLQTVVETLLFYHPAVWWVSARIRQERELCCDDVAVAACGDALCYARALTRLERLRLTTPSMALGSTSGSLLYRIRRIMGEAREGHAPAKLPGILALVLGLACFALNVQWAHGQQPDAPGVAAEKAGQGTVVVEVTIDAAGRVGDARVISGPAELRRSALRTALDWHFGRELAGTKRQVSIAFPLSAEAAKPPEEAEPAEVHGGIAEGVSGGIGEGIGGGVHGSIRGVIRGRVQQERALQELIAKQAEFEAQARAYENSRAELAGNLENQKLLEKMARDKSTAELAESYAEQARQLEKRLLEAQEQLQLNQDARKGQMEAMEKRLEEMRAGMQNFRGPSFAGRRVKSISVIGLTGPQRDELLARLPVHIGDMLTDESMAQIEEAVKRFDEHLGIAMETVSGGQAVIRITAPGSAEEKDHI